MALYTDELAAGGSDWAIRGVGLLEPDRRMAESLSGQDHLYTLIERDSDGAGVRVIGSIVDYVLAIGDVEKFARLLADPELAIFSLTITEGGYSLARENPTLEAIATGLEARRSVGEAPLTILSCDNLPGNGDAARRSTLAAAERADAGLRAWTEANCTFPNSMVDRITPVTAEADREWLRQTAGIEDRWPVVAEPYRQWVMEDAFAAGRPPWDRVGAVFTDRIHDWERYKLRFLNAGHSSIAYLCALADVTFVHEAMAIPAVRSFLEELLHREAMPTVAEIPGHPREEYVASVLERFANPGVRDQIARLCVDGTAKFATFLVPTVVGQIEAGGPTARAATALAGWAHYLAAVDPTAQAFDASGDLARRYASEAVGDPVAFLEFEEVFPPGVRASRSFREQFSEAYRRIAAQGPIAAMEHDPARARIGDAR